MGRYTAHLVGESNYQPAVRSLRAGAPIQLLPERGNRYDPRAIKAVTLTGETVGYIERDSWITRAMIDEGAQVVARVHEVIGGAPPQMKGVVLEIRTGADAAGVAAEGWGERLVDRARPAVAAKDPERLKLEAFGRSKLVGCFVVLGLALVAIAQCSVQSDEPPPAQEKLSAADVAVCRDSLADLQKLGTIRARPSPNRIVVDEALWAAMSFTDKTVLLGALACDHWQTAVPPDGEVVSAYGYRNGERLLTLTNDGTF